MDRSLHFRTFVTATFILLFFCSLSSAQTDSLILYTPYTNVSVSPGNTVNYSIDIINKGTKTRDENIVVSNIPRAWDYSITAGGYSINKMATLPGKKKTLTLKIDIPYQVRKGSYTFYAKAGQVSLPLTIQVSSAGTSVTEFTCDQKNMQGTSNSSFTFNTILKNKTATAQQYALMAGAPRGWEVIIKPNYKQATSTEVEASETKNVTFEIKPSPTVQAGSYKIPVKAVSGSTSASLEFEVVITGNYALALSTPSGLLSSHITAGSDKKVELRVENTGSANLENVVLSAAKPKDWDVAFDTKKIKEMAPGQTETVYATITADKKAIPGDYVVNISAKTPEATSLASFRVSVRTPLTVGLIGLIIILIVLLGIVYLFRKYGRR